MPSTTPAPGYFSHLALGGIRVTMGAMELTTVEVMRVVAVFMALMVMFDGMDAVEALERPQATPAAGSQ